MRPYLAILKDSFREAMASRVLLVLLIVTTLVLLAIAPISLTETRRSLFQPGDVRNPVAFAAAVMRQVEADGPSPGKQIAEYAITGGVAFNNENGESDNDQVLSENLSNPWMLPSTLNPILDEAEFYDAEAWDGVELDEEAKRLVETDAQQLSPADLRRRNRLLLEAAYPQLISSDTSAREVYLGFASYQAEGAVPFSKDDMLAGALNFITDKILGVIGVMIAIVVTASSIPRTYEPGAVDLLLSKPLSRSCVFLTNFVGGCAFILLIGSYFITGLWLIGGLRHGYWNQRFLLCIPLLLFLFAIYYSVSALAGVIWKSAIVSVFITFAFWLFCFSTWSVKTVFEQAAMASLRLTALVAVDDTLVATNQGFGFGADRQPRMWDEETRTWKLVFAPSNVMMGSFPIPGSEAPQYDPHQKRLLAVGQSESFSVAVDDGTAGEFADQGVTSRCLYVGDHEGDWNREIWAYVPDDTTDVFVTHDGRYVLVGASGIFEVSSKSEQAVDAEAGGESDARDNSQQPIVNSYSAIGPDDWIPYTAISMNPRTAALAVLRGPNLSVYEVDKDGQYGRKSSSQLKIDNPQHIAFGGKAIGVSFADGSLATYDADTLQRRRTDQPYGENRVAQLDVSPDGRWLAAVFLHRQLWLYDAKEDRVVEPDIWRQGDVSAVTFTPQSDLAVATAFDHVTEYDPESFVVERSFEPILDTGPWIYWYVITPIYNVFPKPGELGDMVTYLVTGKRTVSSGFQGPQAPAKQLNVWQPLWSNLAFLTVVLGLACLYVERKDF